MSFIAKIQKITASGEDSFKQAFEKLYAENNMDAYDVAINIIMKHVEKDLKDINRQGSDEEFLRTEESLRKLHKLLEKNLTFDS
jgi:hypothetical protein